MLPRKDLINLRQEFPRLRKEGKIYDSSSLGLLVSYSHAAGSGVQCAFVVSKKIDKRSTVRHEVKRKLAEAIKPYLPRLPHHLQLVFLAKQKATAGTKDELGLELEAILHRARLLQ